MRLKQEIESNFNHEIDKICHLQWAPPKRITLGQGQFDYNNRIWLIDTIFRIFII